MDTAQPSKVKPALDWFLRCDYHCCSQPTGKYLDRYGAAKIMSLGLMIILASFLLLAWAPIQNV